MQTHPATHSIELFPETLLVSREGERIYTTSRSVAWHFGKKHKNVLRLIEKLLVDLEPEAGDQPSFGSVSGLNFEPANDVRSDFSRRNFAPAKYRDEQNKSRPEYHLTKAGFMFIAMRFTGQEAAKWQKAFIEAFERMEAELAALHGRYLAALDQIRPNLRPTVEEFERGLPRRMTAQRLGKSEASISYHRSQARRFGLLPARQEVAA